MVTAFRLLVAYVLRQCYLYSVVLRGSGSVAEEEVTKGGFFVI